MKSMNLTIALTIYVEGKGVRKGGVWG